VSERVASVACPKCGREESDPDVSYCPNCGTAIRGGPARRRLRRGLTALFVALTVIALVTSTVAAWARSVALDTDRFVDTVGPVIDDPAVQEALAVRLTDRVMTALDIEGRVVSFLSGIGSDTLPVSPALLAGPITDGIRERLLERSRQLIASDAVSTIWEAALRTAHSQAVALLRGESEVATIEEGAVYIDLLPVVNEVLSELEQPLSDIFNRTIDIPEITGENTSQAVSLLESQFGLDLPDDFGRIKVFESDALPVAQDAIATLDRIVYLLIALTVVLAVISIVLSTRRLRTVLWLGFGSALGLIVVRRLALRLDDAIASRASGENQQAIRSVTADVFGDLRTFSTLLLVATLVIGLGAYFAGKPPWVTRTLQRASDGSLLTRDTPVIRWLGERAQILRIALVAVGAVVLLTVDLGWASFLVVLILLAAGWLALTYFGDLLQEGGRRRAGHAGPAASSNA
jgi:hypothetical protein